MGREIKRVPLEFDWPLGYVWPGFLLHMCEAEMHWATKKEYPEYCEDCKHFALLSGLVDDRSGCPNVKIYPPKGDGWQLWETISEGSPITPVFATADDLVDHMCRPDPKESPIPWDTGYSREAAENFVKELGWAPSLVVSSVGVQGGVEAALTTKQGEKS